MKQQQLELQVADLEAQNAKLRAEIDNLQAPRPAPTILEIIGPEAFERMMELYPSFRESGTPTHPSDAASEVLWSCIRMLNRVQKETDRTVEVAELQAERMTILAKAAEAQRDRMRDALAEYAMQAVEEIEL